MLNTFLIAIREGLSAELVRRLGGTLRCEENDGGGVKEKRLVWEDMLKVMEHVGLPISDKQRGYFLGK